MPKFNQVEYIGKYNTEHYEKVTVQFAKGSKELNHLKKQKNKTDYLRQLILADMNRAK